MGLGWVGHGHVLFLPAMDILHISFHSIPFHFGSCSALCDEEQTTTSNKRPPIVRYVQTKTTCPLLFAMSKQNDAQQKMPELFL